MWRNIVKKKKYIQIDGKEKGIRIESRILEEKIQDAVEKGARHIEINAFGQHGIGGRLWKAGDDAIHVIIKGHSGQRVGASKPNAARRFCSATEKTKGPSH